MENRKKVVYLIFGIMLLIVVIILIYVWMGRDNKTKEDEYETTAMYVPLGESSYIMVDQENNTVFTVEFPEEMYDINGNKISKEDLTGGNIVRIHGNGIMLESYPGQYPGVSRMEVIEQGQASDTGIYQSIIDEIYQEPDPAEPPTLNVEYTTGLAVTALIVKRGGYEWTYMDNAGLSNAVVADSAPVYRWGDELVDAKLEQPVDMILNFSDIPQEVTVIRYRAELSEDETEMLEGEMVELQVLDEKYVIPLAEAGYIYEVIGVWENGRATYGFLTR